MSQIIKLMTMKEMEGIIMSYHRNHDYDGFYDAVV